MSKRSTTIINRHTHTHAHTHARAHAHTHKPQVTENFETTFGLLLSKFKH